jgi:serine/threonine protein kinase
MTGETKDLGRVGATSDTGQGMSVEGTTRGGAPGALGEGSKFGGFRIERTLGRGGMGIVYLATELRLDRQVALKVIRADLAGDDKFRARFRSESRTAASVEDPRVVTVFGAGEVDGLLYVSMRYVPGRDLGRMVEADGPLSPDDAARLIAQVADGLDAVHAAGLVHRDVKPHNVIVDEDGDAHLTDFGLAKAMGATTGLTATGQVIGTVDYMAPEQIEAQRVDARTDVYALGGVLYNAVTGRVPFAERESSAKMWAHVNEPPPSAGKRAGVLDSVIRRAMAKDPIDRFPSAGDLGRAALAVTRGEAVTEPEHVVGAGEAAPLPQTVRLSRDSAIPPTDPQPRPRRPGRTLAFILALLAIAGLAAAAAIEAPKLSRSHGSAATAGTGGTSSPSGVTVPSLAGQPLDVAEQHLDQLGLGYTEEGDTGLFGVLIPSDWSVCDTDPAAGTEVPAGSTVRLLIDRPGSC